MGTVREAVDTQGPGACICFFAESSLRFAEGMLKAGRLRLRWFVPFSRVNTGVRLRYCNPALLEFVIVGSKSLNRIALHGNGESAVDQEQDFTERSDLFLELNEGKPFRVVVGIQSHPYVFHRTILTSVSGRSGCMSSELTVRNNFSRSSFVANLLSPATYISRAFASASVRSFFRSGFEI